MTIGTAVTLHQILSKVPRTLDLFYQSYLEQFDPVHSQFDKNKTAVRQEHFLDVL